jgi:hypothetical protein
MDPAAGAEPDRASNDECAKKMVATKREIVAIEARSRRGAGANVDIVEKADTRRPVHPSDLKTFNVHLVGASRTEGRAVAPVDMALTESRKVRNLR